MKTGVFILSVLILIFIFIKRKKVDKKLFIRSIILYFIVTAIVFFLKKMGMFSTFIEEVVLIYATFIILDAYIFIIFVANLIISRLLNFQIKIGNESRPFIAMLIKNQSLIHTLYCSLFLFGSILGLYGLLLAPRL
ncbi:hypothetical protein [Phocoenobacter skyensis]|uniref:Uncharacterized protein n=1 Tax=Phocoenobacter skyensis TaxID=97481 RepID=A0A1H7ZVC0_9PAST|nr:hypothetical protein [Pasteurella skyensis]MDP8080367.1 hypothetical protein [Pasteurella skyensis]MDP8086343.1 hypothetical protein [Pasteurella skyensis]MDP8186065.1 hypothetical protein [Pasteurella skyensis]QLB22388.1 hypothetical protein A6B44_03895 [Pasteurella skyensis]SEM62206.1 hypothetical protein SAMN05444853_1312 [Pasteurella skyensis]